MAYVKKVWKDLPDETTPINATSLNHIEDGIAGVDTNIGDLTALTTTDKTDTVSAINEVKQNLSDFVTGIGTMTAGILITKTLNAAAWTNMISVTLPAGTWCIIGQMNAAALGLASTIRFDGGTIPARQSVYYADGNVYSNNLTSIETFSVSTTIYMQAWSATSFTANDVLLYAIKLK